MLLLKTQAASFPNTISSHFTWCTHICICRCVHVSTDIHKFMLSTKGQCGYGQQKLVPLELPLLFVNDTNRSFVSTPSLSYITPLPLSFLHFLSLLVKDFFLPLPPSVLIPFVSLFIYCSPSIHPPVPPSLFLSSPDGYCITGMAAESKMQLSFFFPPSLLLSPSLSPQSNFSVFPLRGL